MTEYVWIAARGYSYEGSEVIGAATSADGAKKLARDANSMIKLALILAWLAILVPLLLHALGLF